MRISVRDLMARSGVGFGTSGARGLASAMTDLVCYAYTKGFLQYIEAKDDSKKPGDAVAVAGDLRPSTGRVMEAVARAAADMGFAVVDCGRIPSPAVALFGLDREIPSIMVTGSHIPDDRNGIKFNKASGEMLKEDEQGMTGQVVELDDSLFDANGAFAQENAMARTDSPEARGTCGGIGGIYDSLPLTRPSGTLSPSDGERGGVRGNMSCILPASQYIARYLDFFPHNALERLRVGVYQHSAVGRDLLVTVLSGLGARTTALGRSDTFIPVDTEAIRPEDIELAQAWAQQHRFDAIVSTDGDSDRPLISDEQGRWLRGDVAGILSARFLEADVVCTPVSSNTAVEKTGWFHEVRRTRIGSPYVIAAMMQASQGGAKRVVGYEANGGFLLNSDVLREGKRLRALPTRDALIVILSVLLLARRQDRRISELVAGLPRRFTASDRLKDFATETSRSILARFSSGNDAADRAAIGKVFGRISDQVIAIDRTDGLRVTFANDEIIHLRPSGNAPEFRCYSEAGSDERAKQINDHALDVLRRLDPNNTESIT